MVFSSGIFVFFFLIVFAIQWFVIAKLPASVRLRALHWFLLICSYLFYMSWDYRFGSLMLVSTLVDYMAGRYIENSVQSGHSKRNRAFVLIVSLCVNLGILGFFKYADFFIGSFVDLFNLFSPGTLSENDYLLNIILPLGISFFTFQSMSYTIDVYRNVIPAERNLLKFALFVSFFPQLVAGPIVMAKEFLPQLQSMPVLESEKLRSGVRLFALGFLKKSVLADNIAPLVDAVASNPGAYSTYDTWLAAIAFPIQVYCDFSGYSDMAIGSARMLGFELPENFNLPYIAKSFSDYWSRWHMSLIRWFRDYVYIPLGGNRVSPFRHKFNIFFIMLLSGLWHGAAWTFVVWGGIFGIIMALESVFKTVNRDGTIRTVLFWLFTHAVTNAVHLAFFRAVQISDSPVILASLAGFAGSVESQLSYTLVIKVYLCFAAIIAGHILGYFIFEKKKSLEIPAWAELAAAPVIALLLTQLSVQEPANFIYFVF